MSSKIVLLVKVFDKEEYADAFINKGEIYCQTLKSFKEIEDSGVRGDMYEAASSWHQPDQISLVITYKDDAGVDKSFPISDLSGPVITQLDRYNNLNLYCMYAVKIPDFTEHYETEEERDAAARRINSMLKEKTTLNDEILSLGEYAVVIYRVNDFIDKFENAANKRKYQYHHASVRYFEPDNFSGNFNDLVAVFRKRNIYEYQSEYRFAFATEEPIGAKLLHLGSLEGMAVKIPTRSINSELRLEVTQSD